MFRPCRPFCRHCHRDPPVAPAARSALIGSSWPVRHCVKGVEFEQRIVEVPKTVSVALNCRLPTRHRRDERTKVVVTMKLKRHAIPLAVLACALSGQANSECIAQLYKISGTVTGKSGQPFSGPIAFSWIEEHDGSIRSKVTQAKAGRYGVAIPFYSQAKSKPGAMYTCDARLKSISYMFPLAPGSREAGVVPLLGFQTTANLSVQRSVSSRPK
jgi:hypothetical protein